ncbi:hypothetical protein DFH09DRAFT_1330004 [Mycena vulgaris]|nr:hypothetical protein DFH09DRAFT_1330004 [Mycena vulgaris]
MTWARERHAPPRHRRDRAAQGIPAPLRGILRCIAGVMVSRASARRGVRYQEHPYGCSDIRKLSHDVMHSAGSDLVITSIASAAYGLFNKSTSHTADRDGVTSRAEPIAISGGSIRTSYFTGAISPQALRFIVAGGKFRSVTTINCAPPIGPSRDQGHRFSGPERTINGQTFEGLPLGDVACATNHIFDRLGITSDHGDYWVALILESARLLQVEAPPFLGISMRFSLGMPTVLPVPTNLARVCRQEMATSQRNDILGPASRISIPAIATSLPLLYFFFPTCASMYLAQELIYAVVDAIVADAHLVQHPWTRIIDTDPATIKTLRSCALVGRAYVRPCQMCIFQDLALSDKRHGSPQTLSALLVTNPHLAFYVRGLSVDYRKMEEHLEPIMHILALVTNLTHLAISPDPQRYPVPLPALVLKAFSFPKYLRHIALGYFYFEDVWELHTLLCRNKSLRSLVLRKITLESTEKLRPGDSQAQIPSAESPRIVLESLRLGFMEARVVQAMLDAFTVVDITHLSVLELLEIPMKPLLTLNAPSLQHIKFWTHQSSRHLAHIVDPDALARAHHLQSLDIVVAYLLTLNKMWLMFSSLAQPAHLSALYIRVQVAAEQREWSTLDGLLGALPVLAEVHVYWDRNTEAEMRDWMPVLAGRNVLYKHTY